MPKFYEQNKKRIDPRYFLNETTNRSEGINEIDLDYQSDLEYQYNQAKEYEKKQAAAKAAEQKPGHMSNILKSLSALLADGQVTPKQLRDLADTLEDEQSRDMPGNQGYTKREIDAMDYDEYTARFRSN